MKAKTIILTLAAVATLATCACSRKTEQTASAASRAAVLGQFCADSAYRFVSEQVAMGSRVPGTAAHDSCANYIIRKLQQYGVDTMLVQRGTVTAFDGTSLPLTNIIAGFKPQARKRILLAAHYDTRPWADRDPDPANHSRPIPGANDGASGVGVLLEIARNLQLRRPDVGVDLAFIDCEDYGNNDTAEADDGWCLGSKYWVAHRAPYYAENRPVYGILLDMVGGRDARFHYEYFSQRYAQTPTLKVWSEAEALGYADMFVRSVGGAVNDDHIVLTNSGIPTTDIIECNNVATGSFPPTWHTMADNMDNIDPATLDAVGKTVLNVVYKERPTR